ncbi:MAG TPA: DUF4124 domain-containing protein [Usitatibacter sp.]|nr:DUF4124 domain-containing protein [Usitatibacter sp.]
MKKTCLLLVALFAPHAGAAFKCIDEKGRTHIGDTPPLACANVVMYEVSRSGQVLRKIEPSLTPEQVKAKEEEAARKVEAERAAFEQKRKDTALLQTYSSEKEFDVVLERNIEPLAKSIKLAEERTKAVEKREKEVADEMEFYKAGKGGKGKKDKAPPKSLLEEQERLKSEKEGLAKSIAGYRKEIAEMKARFEVDRKRWVALRAAEKKK